MRKFLLFLLVGITLMGLVACNNTISTQRCIIDCAGDEIELPTDINKVVCVSQNAMEFIVAMGFEDKLIGVHKSIYDHTWSYEFMENLDKTIGFGYSPTAEAIYEAEADLVIVKDSTTAENLRNAGINAITFQYDNESELFYAVNLLGDIFDGNAKAFANKWIKYYQNSVAEIKSKTENLLQEERKSVYFINSATALDAGGLCTTYGGDSIVATWFDAISVNLVTEPHRNITTINEEAILEINPEIIMIGGWAENTRKEQLLSTETWADVVAVKNDAIYLAPVGFVSFERYAVAAPLLIKYSAKQMYPDLFECEMIEEFQQFHKEFYGVELSEEKANYMMEGLSPDGTRMDQW